MVSYPGQAHADFVGGRLGGTPALYAVVNAPLVTEIYEWNGTAWTRFRQFFPNVEHPMAYKQVQFVNGDWYISGILVTQQNFSGTNACNVSIFSDSCSYSADVRTVVGGTLGSGLVAVALGQFGYCNCYHTPAGNAVRMGPGNLATPLGSGLSAVVRSGAFFDNGAGPKLYAGGDGPLAVGDGTVWTSLDPPLSGVHALVAYDDGSGPALYAGGLFTSAGGIPANHIVRIFPHACYANCDGSRTPGGCPTLDVNDFICFMNRFNAGDPAANCDGSSWPPALNINDFICFLTKFAAGCS